MAYPVITSLEADLLSEAACKSEDYIITALVGSVPHLDVLDASAAHKPVILNVCVDVDMSTKFLGVYAGVYRSPLKKPSEVVKIAEVINKYPHLKFRGIMGYEAQIASVGDSSLVLRKMKHDARLKVNERREKVVHALKEIGFEPELVNGGGSGCFQATSKENSITEIAMGSGLYKSHIFDSIETMKYFDPSLYMALRIVRKANYNSVTAFSGGYYASGGGIPPKVTFPIGLNPTKREGFGEVQTPFKYNPKKLKLNLGDLIICRFAKAGEPMERFNEIYLLENGKIKEKVNTYRGEGLWLG